MKKKKVIKIIWIILSTMMIMTMTLWTVGLAFMGQKPGINYFLKNYIKINVEKSMADYAKYQ